MFALCRIYRHFARLLMFVPFLAAGAATADTLSPFDLIAAEIRYAPADIRESLLGSDQRLREFIEGRLLDQALVNHATATGLDREEQVRAAIERFRRDTLVRTVIQTHLEEQRASMPDMTALARMQYLASPQQYALPEAIRVAHILVRIDVETMDDEEISRRKALAQSLHERLKAGEEFDKLARQYSDDVGSARSGGRLPNFVSRGALVPPFEDAAFSLEVGELSSIVRTRFGFHVIKLVERRSESTRPFEEVREAIVGQLEKEWLDPRREAFINQFRSATLVQEADELEREIRELYKSDAAAAPR